MTTRNKIIEAALELFKLNGYGKTTMREIANKVGINLSLLNYHFPRKQEIIYDIFEIMAKEMLEKGNEVIHDNEILSFYYVFHQFFPIMMSEEHQEFYFSVINRTNKDSLETYSRFMPTNNEIVAYLNLHITEEDLLYRNMYLFSGCKEMINAYLQGALKVSEKELIDMMFENMGRVMGIADYIIEDTIIKGQQYLNR